jgi:hypothetical protein
MKRIFAALIVFSLSSPCLAAETNINTENWVLLNAENAFTLRAPPETKFKQQQAIDSVASSFENPKFEINFDYGHYSNTLGGMKSDPSYKVEDILIDGRKGVLVTGAGKAHWGCKDLVTAAYVVVARKSGDWGDTRLEIDGCAKSPEDISTLQEIFRTIVFADRRLSRG